MEEVLCSTKFQYSLLVLRGILPYLSLVVVVVVVVVVVEVVVVVVVVDAPLSELGYRGRSADSQTGKHDAGIFSRAKKRERKNTLLECFAHWRKTMVVRQKK